jgi:hypothetical protein
MTSYVYHTFKAVSPLTAPVSCPSRMAASIKT